jgi:large subunit ribosomal protein L3
MKIILGKKLGSSQIFDDNGNVIPVTVIEAPPGLVVAKNIVAFVESKKINKATEGRLKAAKINKKLKYLIEIPDLNLKTGEEVKVDIFDEKEKVNVSGISKGKGFAGVIKRHKFSRGPETHGSDHHRAPGSIGSMFPQHVFKGKKMPGHLGNAKVTIKNLEIVKIIPEQNLIFIKGAVPGARGGIVKIKSKK